MKTRDVELNRSSYRAILPLLTPKAAIVYLFIAFHTDKGGTARLTDEEIRAGCKIGSKGLADAISNLETIRLIRIVGDGTDEIHVLAPYLRGSKHKA